MFFLTASSFATPHYLLSSVSDVIYASNPANLLTFASFSAFHYTAESLIILHDANSFISDEQSVFFYVPNDYVQVL